MHVCPHLMCACGARTCIIDATLQEDSSQGVGADRPTESELAKWSDRLLGCQVQMNGMEVIGECLAMAAA